MKIKFLGTGTSSGIPVIACNCSVCKSTNTKNRRTRSSILIEIENNNEKKNILIDSALDFREQALRENIDQIDAVLITHDHADHLFGLDDLRVFSYKKSIPIFCEDYVIKSIEKKYDYIFDPSTQKGGGLPHFSLNKISDSQFVVENKKITPIPVKHGKLDIVGFRIDNFTYITDASYISEESIKKIMGTEILVLNALKFSQHPTHFNVEQAIETVKKISPKRAYFTHICHNLEHNKVNKYLPQNISLAYDGLELEI